MRTLLVFAASCALCSACSKKETVHQKNLPYSEAVAAIQKAQDDAERVYLPKKLIEAGSDLSKLRAVYVTATRLHENTIAAEADKKIEMFVLPRVTAHLSKRVIRRYLKKVPSGSTTEKKLRTLLEETSQIG